MEDVYTLTRNSREARRVHGVNERVWGKAWESAADHAAQNYSSYSALLDLVLAVQVEAL